MARAPRRSIQTACANKHIETESGQAGRIESIMSMSARVQQEGAEAVLSENRVEAVLLSPGGAGISASSLSLYLVLSSLHAHEPELVSMITGNIVDFFDLD